MRRLLAAALWTLGAGVAVAGQTPATPGVQMPTDSPATRANLLPRPRVRIGEWFTLEVIAKLQGDLARFDRVVDEDDEEFYWARRRLGIRGELWDRVGFEVERAFGVDEEPWRDVYLNVRASNLFEVRGGKFKVPFGLDNLTSSAEQRLHLPGVGDAHPQPGPRHRRDGARRNRPAPVHLRHRRLRWSRPAVLRFVVRRR